MSIFFDEVAELFSNRDFSKYSFIEIRNLEKLFSTNESWLPQIGKTKTGRRYPYKYLIPEARNFKNYIKWIIQENYGYDFSEYKKRGLDLVFFFYVPKRAYSSEDGKNYNGGKNNKDLSNYIKITEDAVMEALGLNDKPVLHVEAFKLLSKDEDYHILIGISYFN